MNRGLNGDEVYPSLEPHVFHRSVHGITVITPGSRMLDTIMNDIMFPTSLAGLSLLQIVPQVPRFPPAFRLPPGHIGD